MSEKTPSPDAGLANLAESIHAKIDGISRQDQIQSQKSAWKEEQVGRMDDQTLQSTCKSVKDWVEGKTELYYLSPPDGRPTVRDLEIMTAELEKRGLKPQE